jgi:hypothetical protein
LAGVKTRLKQIHTGVVLMSYFTLPVELCGIKRCQFLALQLTGQGKKGVRNTVDIA